jgi:predicted dehydrogenase
MGRVNLRDFLRCEDVEVVAICDVWQPNVARAVELTNGKAAGYQDFRRIIDRKDIDIAVISTPDHWHAYMVIQACLAGKDVYVEKPLAHNIHEGRRMVEAARKHSRVVQVGTQQRSGSHYQKVVNIIQSGKIGNISRVAAWNFENLSPYGVGKFQDSEPPADLDYEMWLGPAPKRPFNPSRFIYSFRYFWDYAGGYATDWGVHHIDAVQWAMNERGPRRVSALGGKYYVQDGRETPDTLEVIYEYSNFILTYSNRILNANPLHDRAYGIAFYGTDATLVVDRAGYDILPETRGTFERPEPFYMRELEAAKQATIPSARGSQRDVWVGRTATEHGDGSEQHLTHVRNFIECVKTRKKPASDVEIAHHSTATTHLANIAFRTGRSIQWNSESEKIENDVEAASYLSRKNREPWAVI